MNVIWIYFLKKKLIKIIYTLSLPTKAEAKRKIFILLSLLQAKSWKMKLLTIFTLVLAVLLGIVYGVMGYESREAMCEEHCFILGKFGQGYETCRRKCIQGDKD